MKISILLSILLALSPAISKAQKALCKSTMDTAAVVKIAKRHNAYWTENWIYTPTLKFDSAQCTWSVSSGKTRYTKKGKCKYTNGCTETTIVVLVIDAQTRKVKSRKTDKTRIHNYE